MKSTGSFILFAAADPRANPGGLIKARAAGLSFLALILISGCTAKSGGAKAYEYAAISRGALEKTVSASGTLNPVSTVNVLPRMSGKVEKIYVDYNDTVRKGEVLAELNTDMLKLQREQQSAAVIKARANYELQQINYRSQEKLAEKNLISEYEFKTGKTALDIQGAELAAAEASFRVIETEINQYAFITSPIDGIILERNISEGATVVDGSSSNSSSIFTIAENLEEMQIEAGVGELDIAGIYKGQEVRFTLESLPGRTYTGMVETKRLMPTVQDNVVTYKVIINVENQDGSLLPGMTCAVDFIEERSEGILLVPNGALRYQPTALSAGEIADRVFYAGLQGMDETRRAAALEARRAQNAAQAPAAQSGGSQGGLAGLVMPVRNPREGPAGPAPGSPGGQGGSGSRGTANSGTGSGAGPAAAPAKPLWYLSDGGNLDCLLVQTGISDGSYTEIRPAGPGERDLEGMRIILREKL
ncbi:MAG: efflux RND transporter periplasmic adaptor subunit [Treponema sp.]|jgi:HlyD family secretion protein|nr:efflux RND transporter periplasmic adaptor subunit [Treponema sp.]